MEAKLLGPFELRVAGQLVPVPSAKTRTILAALLVEPGRIVPATELIDALWGDRPPKHPRRALHVCLTRVRAGLAAAGAPQLIVAGAAGYHAAVPPDAVDVTRFHGLVERGALAEALDLWRGEPLADIPSDHLHRAYAVPLAEQRLLALERWADEHLRAGRPHAVVARLAELTARHPLRERLWTLYLTALRRTGRRSDALTAYHRVRQHLADELGIEPGEELQQVYAAMLSGPGQAPRQLPAAVAGFAGRSAELTRMRRPLDGGSPLVVTGMPGVGKTALAAHWARRVADRFPDGQLWLDLHGHDATPRQALGGILRALGVRTDELPADLDGRAGLYRSMMDGRRMLLVLDNAGGADQVRPLLPGDPRTFVLITSRYDLSPLVALDGARVIQLRPLTVEEARRMLESRLGARRVRAEPDAVDRIVAHCRGLPLALALVAARAVARPSVPLEAVELFTRAAARPRPSPRSRRGRRARRCSPARSSARRAPRRDRR